MRAAPLKGYCTLPLVLGALAVLLLYDFLYTVYPIYSKMKRIVNVLRGDFMDNQMNKLIHQFILFPLAIKVLQHDKKIFSDFKMRNVYQGKIDSSIMQLQQDLSSAKKQMYTQYRISVKQIGQCSYEWHNKDDSGVITYTSEQLKTMTTDVIKQYLYGHKAKPFEIKEGWY